jgi:catechol 2,3-dioxygenase-like lactoylglutathione lyase family enzyme
MITGLLHYGMAVPDLNVAEKFYGSFGLELSERGGSLVAGCAGSIAGSARADRGRCSSAHPRRVRRPRRLTERAPGRLAATAVPFVDPLPDITTEGLWVRDPDGGLVLLTEAAPTPARPYDRVGRNVGGQYERVDVARWSTIAAQAQPRRLGHLLVFSPDPVAMERFYVDLLGLRLSDRIGDKVTFLNAGPGDHHVFGFIRSSHPGFHHASFEVEGIDEMAVGAACMVDKGYREGWGLGRHTMGSNLFHYTKDPWGSWIEYFSDIDQITEDWRPSDWGVPPMVWGPAVPRGFPGQSVLSDSSTACARCAHAHGWSTDHTLCRRALISCRTKRGSARLRSFGE